MTEFAKRKIFLIPKLLLGIISVSILGYLLYWRYRLGVGRYFDADEFSYLFWGYQFHLGLKPYSDFFYFLPPFFLYPISWIFDYFGRNVSAVETARVAMFGVYLFSAAPIFLIIRKMRGSLTAVLTLIVFAVLPLPYDKMIEVRPDTLAYGFALWGIYFFFLSDNKKRLFSSLSGLFFAVSLLIIPKTLPLLFPTFLVLLVKFLFTKKTMLRPVIREIGLFITGFIVPSAVALIIIYISGGWPKAFYFMTRFASESTAILGKEYYIQTYQFFGDYIDAYYGKSGFSIPWLFNLLSYIISYVFCVYRFVTAFKYGELRRGIMEFVMASLFIINLYMYVMIYPLKHAQYLIPIAPLVGLYLTDFILSLSGIMGRKCAELLKNRRMEEGIVYISAFLLSAISFYVAEDMNSKKIWWGNQSTYNVLKNLLKDVPKDAPVYDLSGGSVFFKTGYYFCCLPYGQYEKALRFDYPEITADAKAKNMSYVHAGAYGWGALGGIPKKHADYIKENFKPFYPDNSVLIRK